MKTCPNNSYLSLLFEPHCRLLRVRLPKTATVPPELLSLVLNLHCTGRKVKVAPSCDSLRSHGLSSPWNSPGQNTGVCSCSLLQGIFPNQGSNPGLQHFRLFLYQLNHQGRDLFLEFPHSNPTLTSSFPMRQIMN